MENSTVNRRRAQGHLEMRWVPVTDRHGRTHMQARWTTVDAAPDQAAISHSAA